MRQVISYNVWMHAILKSKRNADDATVEGVVNSIHYATQEVTLLELTKNWNDTDFLYALERVEIKHPEAQRAELRALYHRLRREQMAAAERMAMADLNARRHEEIASRLQELRKSHWSVVPNFWLTLAILGLTALGVWLEYLVVRH